MISCIIYEDNEEMQKLYQEVVKTFFMEKDINVKFYVINKYQKDLENKLCNLSGKKIFILDIEVPGKSGLDLARIIRSSGDWNSPLIIVTSYDHLKDTGFTSKMLMLDFISKKENIRKRLQESLKIVEDIVNQNDTYTFQYNGELYHVNYQDILCFEKDLNDNYTFLYTKSEKYKIKESITNIEKDLLNNECFFKIHRSCIININNVTELNLETNTVYLDSYSTSLLTKENRELLRKNLDDYQIIG